MTTTMQLIAKQTVGSGGAASVTFSNIPQTYTDLKVVTSFRGTTAQVYEITALRFNGLNANLSSRTLEGSGSAASSLNNGYIYLGSGDGASATANTFGSIEAYIPNYTSSNQKSVSIDAVGENNATTIYMQLTAGLWANTAAITSIEIVPTGNFVEFSTFYLYGISNSTTTQATTVPYASGGDVITTDGSYWYHAFKYSGSFTPLKNLTADVLVVAGGGGGGRTGGGGGAGGLRALTAQSLTTSTNYTCTIGAGGAGNNTDGQKAGSGINSSIIGTALSITGTGGGGAASYGAGTGLSGGSGGGGAGTGNAGGSGNSGSYSPVEGYAGGTGGTGVDKGGGGGGAGAVGNNGDSGSGGIGATSSLINAIGAATVTGQLSGGNYYYAGGGGAAQAQAGGLGGGGASGSNAPGIAGTANTGGGGGSGTGNTPAGANGGSGIIIVRYAV